MSQERICSIHFGGALGATLAFEKLVDDAFIASRSAL
jgi:hypothetical protein